MEGTNGGCLNHRQNARFEIEVRDLPQMSRFKNSPKAAAATTMAAGTIAGPRAPFFAPPPYARSAAMPSQPVPIAEPGSPNIVASVGFVLYCAYILSGFANDWAIRLLGNKVYISTITVLLLPVAWLLSGNALRGLQRPVGRWWAAFLIWMLLATPFSVWKGGSAMLLWNYVPRGYLQFFYICAFATSIRRCRSLMFVNIAGAVVLLLTCVKFGSVGDGSDYGRFLIPQSLFFSNANDLGLALLLGITSFWFLVSQPGIGKRIAGMLGILLCVIYTLKTGSRGCLLALIALSFLIFLFSRNKVMTVLIALPIIGITLLMLPSATRHRLLLFGTETEAVDAQGSSDVAAIGSQLERRELFKTSVALTLQHPLLGVGPDEFAVAMAGDRAKIGLRSPWLGTHNSYTQVSSECGIPALICYCAVLFLSFRTNLRIFRQSRDNPALKDVASLSFCLMAGILVYAVSTFFFHIAYSGGLPILAGFSLALRLAAEPLLSRSLAHRPGQQVLA